MAHTAQAIEAIAWARLRKIFSIAPGETARGQQSLAFPLQREHQSVALAHLHRDFGYIMSVIAFLIDLIGTAGLSEANGMLSLICRMGCDEIGICVDHVVLGIVQMAARVLRQGGQQLGAQYLEAQYTLVQPSISRMA